VAVTANKSGETGLIVDDEIRLGAIVRLLWQRRWWIIVPTVLCTAVAVVVVQLMTPVYRATVVVVPADIEGSAMGALGSALGQLSGLASLAGGSLGNANSKMQESLAVLKSREFTERFIAEENLLPRLFAEEWDATAKRWTGPKERWPSLVQGYNYFDKEVRMVERDRITGLITVSIDWHDRAEAARWANQLVARLNAEMRKRAIDRTSGSVVYLERELENASAVETRQAINRLIEAQINQRMLANVTQEYAFRVVDAALTPGSGDRVAPRKVLITAGVMFVSAMLSVFAVLVLTSIARSREGANLT
jgi:uncharacterized protein involved in exopolysaccharide biosynthesis